MSEALTLTPELGTTELIDNQETVKNHEVKDPSWGNELMNFVSANQNVIVRCPWMGGAEVTLGEAMTTYSYPPNMTEKDLPTVTAVVHELLANRVEEKEEPGEEQEEPEEAKTLEKEEDKPEENAAKAEENPKTDQKVEAEIKQPTAKAENPDKTKTDNENTKPTEAVQPQEAVAAEDAVPPSPVQNETVVDSPKAGAETSNMNRSEVTAPGSVTETAAPDTSSYKAGPAAPESLTETQSIRAAVTADSETSANQPASDLESARMEVADILASEASPDQEAILEIPAEALDLAETTEEESEIIADIEMSDLLEPDTIENLVDLSAEDEIDHQDLDETIVDYEVGEEELTDLAEQGEIIIDHRAEIELPADEQLDNLIFLPKAEPPQEIVEEVPEQLAQLELRIEEVEDSLMQLVEQIEDSEPKVVEAAIETLDQITELAAGLEPQDEAETQEKLEELFAELFNQLDVEYTPELIQSLVRLTLQKHLFDQAKTDSEEDTKDLPQADGTHEMIKKLLAGAGSIKKALQNAGAIGKSAIRLYVYDFPTELRKRLAA